MSTYKGIKGFTVKFLSADPPVAQEGQVFYNSTSEKLKVFTPTAGTSSWSTGDSLSVAQASAAGVGPNTASFIFGGSTPSATDATSQSQTYNGSAWSTAPNMTYATQGHFTNNDLGGNTSSLAAGGRNGPGSNEGLTSTTSWNGSTWSSETTFPGGRRYGFSAGTGESIIASGGLSASPITGFPGQSDKYNGTAWSSAPALNTNRSNGTGGGLYPSGIAFAGCAPPYCATSNVVETWNATTWSTSPATFPSSASTNTHTFAGGGMPSGKYVNLATAFDWNGTTFSSGTARSSTTIDASALSGTPTTAFIAGGSSPPGRQTTVELWTTTAPSVTAKDISLD